MCYRRARVTADGRVECVIVMGGGGGQWLPLGAGSCRMTITGSGSAKTEHLFEAMTSRTSAACDEQQKETASCLPCKLRIARASLQAAALTARVSVTACVGLCLRDCSAFRSVPFSRRLHTSFPAQSARVASPRSPESRNALHLTPL